MLDHRKWIETVLAHRETGGVPYNLMLSPPARKALEQHYAADRLEDALGLPVRMTSCQSIKPLYASPKEFGPRATDEFGVVWTTSEIDRGAPVGPCLREPDLGGYSFPDARVESRFELLDDWCRENREHFRVVWAGDLLERAAFMRGMEDILMDVALNRRFVERLLRGIADYFLATEKILLDRFEFEAIAISDDYGSQHGMLISPRDWRALVKPLLKEIYAFTRSRGRRVFHHTCGHVIPIIPDLIEIGLDILHPIQPEAMDICRLKREFGRDLTFCGGLRTQDILPRGTPAQVRDEVRRLKETMGKGGGYILEPGITIQADVPIRNLLALIEEARKRTGSTE